MNSLDLNILQEIENELNTYCGLSKTALFNKFINNKLAATLRNYNEEIDATSDYLLQQASFRVLKAITKIKKVSDKDIIQQYMENNND